MANLRSLSLKSLRHLCWGESGRPAASPTYMDPARSMLAAPPYLCVYVWWAVGGMGDVVLVDA